MEWTWKKTLGVVVFFVLIFVTPFFLISNTMMDYYHEKVDADPKSENSKWLALKTANICLDTWRPARAAKYYEKYLELYPDDEQAPEIMLLHAQALEDCLKYAEAAKLYRYLQVEYIEADPDLSGRAKEGWVRCKYGVGNR